MKNQLSLGRGVLWVLIWFGFMLVYTALDVGLWRKISPLYSKYLNLFSIILCMAVFLTLLVKKTHFKIDLLENLSIQGILLGITCAILFYFLLDKGFDPILEKNFPVSEEGYQQTLQTLRATPVISLLRICILAPFIEEILMRGFLLNGLSIKYGKIAGLLISSLLFALLHFNMVQTLSAFLSGMILGLLYLHTGSITCCILAHMGYNLISYITTILPLYHK